MFLFRDIARRFSNHIEVSASDADEEISSWEQQPNSQPMTVEEKMGMWNAKDRGAVEEQAIPDEEQNIQKEVNFSEALQVSAARVFLFKSTQFQWLLGRLRAAVSLTMWQDSALQKVSTAVTSCLKQLAPSKTQNAIFKVAWDPLAFVEEQEYPSSEGNIIERVINISGSARDAQALICTQYMEQTWPTTGVDLLPAISSAISKGYHAKVQSTYNYLCPGE